MGRYYVHVEQRMLRSRGVIVEASDSASAMRIAVMQSTVCSDANWGQPHPEGQPFTFGAEETDLPIDEAPDAD